MDDVSQLTKPAVEFMQDSCRVSDLELFLRDASILFADFFLDVDEKSFDVPLPLPSPESLLLRFEGQDTSKLQFAYYDSLIAEMILCRMADKFLVYLSQLLALIFQTRPETMKPERSPEQQVKVDFILQYSTMEELVSAIADKRVEQLSYSTEELIAYFQDRLGLALFPTPEQLRTAITVIELRNITVHNSGIISRMFKNRVPSYSGEVGDRVKFTYEVVRKYTHFLSVAVWDIDERAAKKFGLATKPFE